MELLLEPHDVRISKPDDHDQTRFSFAAKSGDKAVVKLLLGREDVDPGKLGIWGQTSLSPTTILRRGGVMEPTGRGGPQTPALFPTRET